MDAADPAGGQRMLLQGYGRHREVEFHCYDVTPPNFSPITAPDIAIIHKACGTSVPPAALGTWSQHLSRSAHFPRFISAS